MSHHPSPSESGPHLDHLEALARAATPGPWSWWTSNSTLRLTGADGRDGGVLYGYARQGDGDVNCAPNDQAFIAAANPAAVLALIALARRAQPEREAPQAVAGADLSLLDLAHLFAESQETGRPVTLSASASGVLLAAMTTAPAATLSPLCGAQHAESGKEDGPLSAKMHDLVDDLREYAGYPGYSHGDYADTMRQAASVIEALRAQLYHWGPLAAQQAAAPGTPEAPKELGLDIAVAVNQKIGKYIAANKPALMLLNEDELAALYRFQETCEDSDSGGYDVDKEMMKRLAAIGVIESKGFGRYQFTEFGDFVVERAAQLDGGQEGSESNG